MTGGLAWRLVRGFVYGVALAELALACGNDSSSPPTGGNSSGAGQAGSPTQGGSGGAAQGGGAIGGSPQAGGGGTPNVPSGGGGAAQGGKAGAAGSTSLAGGGDGGAHAGGAGGESAAGGSDGGAGAGVQCDTTPVAQPPGAVCAIAPSVGEEYKVGTSTEVLSFGVRLRAGFFGPVRVNEIEVHYYFSQEETSGFKPVVDSFVIQPGNVDLTASSEISIVPLNPKQDSTSGPGCQTHFIRIRNSSTFQLTKQGPYAELHVTLTPNDPAPPNQNHDNDHSYVPEANDWTDTARLGVYHCGQITSGCTPGDAGTCD